MDVAPPGVTQYASARGGMGANAAWLMLAEVGGKLAGLVFVVVVARELGAANYGYFSFALALVPLFLMLSTWALELNMVRDVAREPGRLSPLFASGLALRASLGIGALGVSLALLPLFLPSGAPLEAGVLVGAALFLDQLSAFVGSVFKAFERMAFYAGVIFTNRAASAALAVTVVMNDGGLVAVCVTYLLGSAGALVVAVLAMRHFFPPVSLRDASRREMARLARTGAALGLANALSMASFRVDTVLLQAIKGPVAVGLYGVAYRFLDASLFGAWSIGSAALPRLSRTDDRHAVETTVVRATTAVLAFYVPLAVGSLFAAEELVVAAFTERYRASASAVSILLAAGVFYGVVHVFRIAAIARGGRGRIAVVAVAVLALNIVLNAVVIPRWGFSGAAVTTLVTEVVEALLLVHTLARVHGRVPLGPEPLAPVLAGIAMGLVLWALGVRGFVAVALGAPLYAAGLVGAMAVIAGKSPGGVLSWLRLR